MSDTIRETTTVDVIAAMHGGTIDGAQYTLKFETYEQAEAATEVLARTFRATIEGFTAWDHTPAGGFFTVHRKGIVLAHVRCYTDPADVLDAEEPPHTCQTCFFEGIPAEQGQCALCDEDAGAGWARKTGEA
jgi:hypothetical protein